MHLFWQTTYVMVRLNDLSSNVERFYSVRIDSALCEPLGSCLLLCFSIKNLHKVTSYYLTFLLRVGNTCKVAKELLTGINTDDIQAETLIVVHYIPKLILAQHAVVNKDTCEVLADGLIEKHSTNRAVNTSGESEDNLIVTQLLFEFTNSGIDERGSRPVLLGTADINHKVLQEKRALQSMEHLRMELHSPYRSLLGTICSILYISSRGDALAVGRDGGDRVTMTHPYL